MDHRVAELADIPDGGMRAVDVMGICVLLSRSGNEVTAVGGHCTHQGAPLADGVRVGKSVICPWHHAMFDLASGEHLEPPGEGRLTAFSAKVEDGAVIVSFDDQTAKESRDEIDDVAAHKSDSIFAVVGAGAAGSAVPRNYAGRATTVAFC